MKKSTFTQEIYVFTPLFCVLIMMSLIGTVFASPSKQSNSIQETPTPNPGAITTSGWPMYGYDAGNSRYNPSAHLSLNSVHLLQQAWSAPTGALIGSSPAVANGIAYVGSNDGFLYAFNTIDGKLVWKQQITTDQVHSSPAVANGLVYVGSYVGSADSHLYAFDADTGTPKWKQLLTTDLTFTGSVVANGAVYIGSSRYLYKFDATSGERKENIAFNADIMSSPAIADGIMYVTTSQDGMLHAINVNTGQVIGGHHVGVVGLSSPAIANGIVFIGTYNTLYAFNARTGTKLWMAPSIVNGGGPSHSSAAVVMGTVYIGFGKDLRAYRLC